MRKSGVKKKKSRLGLATGGLGVGIKRFEATEVMAATFQNTNV